MKPYLLHHLLEVSAARVPDNVAVIDGERSLTYGELDRRANQVGHLLRRLGLGTGDRIGLHLDKSAESLIALYGVLKTAGAYVPLDPQAPAARLAEIARDCRLPCILTTARHATRWLALAAEAPELRTLVLFDSPSAQERRSLRRRDGVELIEGTALTASPDVPVPAAGIDLDPAYVLYTSGSTGRPKGVVLPHRAAMAFVTWATDAAGVTAADRLSSVAPLHFDLSVFDLFAAAAAGATAVLVPPATLLFPVELRQFIERERITIWYSVPSLLSMLALKGGLHPGDLPELRAVLFAGEAFPVRHLRRLMALVPGARFINLYGPTETNVCTWYEVERPPAEDGVLPIGKAIQNVRVFALTDEGSVAARGDIGELCVQGATVMQSYWGDPEATGRALVSHRVGGHLRPAYRTGDLVQEMSDGNYRFLGRRDAQVKIRGVRVELGEIEAVLAAHEGVVESAAIALPDELASNRLEAVVVVSRPLESRELVRWCAERLPGYMVPGRFQFVTALPRTSTGKVDRQLLAAGRREADER